MIPGTRRTERRHDIDDKMMRTTGKDQSILNCDLSSQRKANLELRIVVAKGECSQRSEMLKSSGKGGPWRDWQPLLK